MIDIEKDKCCLHVSGLFYYEPNNEAGFESSFKTGMRPIIWYNDKKICTSVHVIAKEEIMPDEKKEIEMIILSPFTFKESLIKGNKFVVGKPGYKIGTFELKEIKGYWESGKSLPENNLGNV